jgi:hypothetical protein
MSHRDGAVHVARVVRKYETKSGPRESISHLLRRSYREDGKIKHDTLGNISALPPAAIEAVRAVLAGKTLVDAEEHVRTLRSLPHGHVAAVWAMARTLGLPGLLGPAGRDRDLALALIVSRVVRPASKLSTRAWWADVTVGTDLAVADASTDEVYAAMDWLLQRQDGIEAALARRHLAPQANPARRALFDLSSSWMTGSCCELAARGYSRDGKKGLPQIEYGLLTDPAGRPVAVRVFPGNTGDPTAFVEAVTVVREKFGLTEMVMVADRGMITTARIAALRKVGGMGWLTALRAPAIAKLAAEDGPLQLSLFDQQDLAEITHPDYPGERLIACRNPALAAERARKRAALLEATDALLAPIITAVAEGRLTGADRIGVKVGKVVNRRKMAKHLIVEITDTSLTITRDTTSVDAEAALDGIYVLRTTIPAPTPTDRPTDTTPDTPDQLPPKGLPAAGVVSAYKDLANLERDFRIMKVDDLDLRPVRHWLVDRVKAHVLICMLAAYLTWHLRRTLAPLTYTDQQPPVPDNPVAPARRSSHADAKAAAKTGDHDQPLHDFRGLLDHLATLTRTTIAVGQTTFDQLSTPTPLQRQAFALIGAPIPTHLTPA